MVEFLGSDTFRLFVSPIIAALATVVVKHFALEFAHLRDRYVPTIWLELLVFSFFSVLETIGHIAARADELRALFDTRPYNDALIEAATLIVLLIALTILVAPFGVSIADRTDEITVAYCAVHFVALVVLGFTWLWIVGLPPT